MKRIIMWLASTCTVVVLLFGYRTSTNSVGASAEAGVISKYTSSTQSSTSAAPGATSSASSGPTPPTGTSTSTAVAYTGSVAQTRWGPVQVQITVDGGHVTAVDVLEYPTGNGKDQQINSYALPVLVQETMDAQSADIDMVSGATVTSDGYVESLQSALDQAGL